MMYMAHWITADFWSTKEELKIDALMLTTLLFAMPLNSTLLKYYLHIYLLFSSAYLLLKLLLI